MTTLTLQLSDESVVTLPAELAQQAGLTTGEVQIILGNQSIIVAPAFPATDFSTLWDILETSLREQARQFSFSQENHRDAMYWEIVTPLFTEAERTI